ncbi:MAG: hypothetical protein ACT443_07165 [Gemmatimonadota bacterium]
MQRGTLFETARYSFQELNRTRSMLGDVFRIGATSIDIDEVSNAVRIGVANAEAEKTINAHLRGRALTMSQISLVIEKLPRRSEYLHSYIRPVLGGITIYTSKPTRCTYGFNAMNGGQRVMFLNSHCTKRMAAVDSDTVYQDSQVPSHFMAVEWKDPYPYVYLNGPYPCNIYSCRKSDAAAAILTASVSSSLGKIAYPTQYSPSLEFDPGFPATITSTKSSGAVGDPVIKVGQTTGRTEALITQTCVTYGPYQVTCTCFANSERTVRPPCSTVVTAVHPFSSWWIRLTAVCGFMELLGDMKISTNAFSCLVRLGKWSRNLAQLLSGKLSVIVCAMFLAWSMACSDPVDSELITDSDTNSVTVNGVQYRGHTEPAGATLRTTIIMLNESNAELLIELSGCALRVRAFDNSDAAGVPVWDSGVNRPPCQGAIWHYRLAPGDSAGHEENAFLNLTAGRRYYFRTTLAPNDSMIVLKTGSLDLR